MKLESQVGQYIFAKNETFSPCNYDDCTENDQDSEYDLLVTGWAEFQTSTASRLASLLRQNCLPRPCCLLVHARLKHCQPSLSKVGRGSVITLFEGTIW